MPQLLPREEDILRAVAEAHCDGKRFDTDLFEGKRLSVPARCTKKLLTSSLTCVRLLAHFE